jgi:serine/threonine protein kinase
MSNEHIPDDLIGKTLGQYTILEEIGRGGMATVYRARQQSIDRIVAIKVLPRHFLHDPGFFERFEREVKVITELEHPHILPIYDYGESGGIPYIVMRYLAGGSMAQMVRRGVATLDLLEKPLMQVAQALDYAHLQGVIHRDLKPGNIMLDENGNAYLSDFGIARVMGSDLTGSAIIGTPAYMSPEQANGLPIDGRADIYALGVVLFELITGREPYQAETPMALLLKHINEPMPLAREFREDVPPSVEEVIATATAKEPDDRYASASEMAKDFTRALASPDAVTRPAGAVSQARPPSTPMPTIPAAGGATTQPLPADLAMQTGPITGSITGQFPARSGPSMGLILGVVAVLAIIIIGGALIVIESTGSHDQGTPVPAANIVPTAFPRASTITETLYTISIPDEWIPPQLFIDESTNERTLHMWSADDNSAFVKLALVNAELNGDSVFFQAAVDDYSRKYLDPQKDQMRLIDETTAEDGTLRRSYRLEGEEYPYGQLDVFFLERDPYLAVVEMFTADSTANTLVSRLQLILDSLRVKTSA